MNWTTDRRFGLLRGLCKVLVVVAWAALGLTILIAPVGLARAVLGGVSEEIWDWVRYGLSGIVFFLYGLLLAQAIRVVLAIEENTRQATLVLEKLTTLTQQVRDRVGAAGGPDASPGGTPGQSDQNVV